MWNEAKTLPVIGEDVLVYSGTLDLIAVASLERASDGSLYWETDSDTLGASGVESVTHWMPLPDRPS